MDKVRYSEKSYLCDYDLSLEFFKEIGIKVNDIYPLRKVFMISSDSGNKILKKVDYDEDRVIFIDDCLNYIKKTYNNVISYNKLKNGLSYQKWKDDIYVVMDILDGREVTFSNIVENELCACSIASMHNASNGIREYLKDKYNKDFLDISLKEKYTKSYKELVEIKNVVKNYKYKNEFDTLFMENVDSYLNEIEITIDELNKSDYKLLRMQDELISICHNDLAYHNFLIKDMNVSILDFDFLTIDLSVMDVADFILKSIKNVAFDVNKMIMSLNSYEDIRPLNKEEKEIVYIALKFPRDFCAIVRDYYYKRKKWNYEVYLNRFEAKMNNEEFRHDLLKEYKKILN